MSTSIPPTTLPSPGCMKPHKGSGFSPDYQARITDCAGHQITLKIWLVKLAMLRASRGTISQWGDAVDRETVIALVAPLGCPVEETIAAFEDAFARHGFKSTLLRISDLLDREVDDSKVAAGASRVERLMNKGDYFRYLYDSDGACSFMASQAISLEREKATGSTKEHRPRFVTIIRSLKTPGEVSVLRQIYGSRVIVVGVNASPERRTKELVRQLKPTLGRVGATAEASALLDRDEKDERSAYGQRTRDAFQMADALVTVRTKGDRKQVDRLVDLLLGEPFNTPTQDEQGMFSAWGAKFRSSAAGRQVGAAIVDKYGEVVALGCNDVPRPGGGQYWPEHADDRRDFQIGFDANDRGKHGAAASLLGALQSAGWLSHDRAGQTADSLASAALEPQGPLELSEFADLIEYGRIVHAEMAALMTAARSGRAVEGLTLYTTTYPCHECARLIIAAGIRRVCFVDPYPKSRAPELYDAMWGAEEQVGVVRVEQFSGVSPRMFARLFEMCNRARDVTGAYEEWTTKNLVVLDEELSDSIPINEEAALLELVNRKRSDLDDAPEDS